MVERYLDLDFSSIQPKVPEVEDEQEEGVDREDAGVDEEVAEGGHGATIEGSAEELAAPETIDVSQGDAGRGGLEGCQPRCLIVFTSPPFFVTITT